MIQILPVFIKYHRLRVLSWSFPIKAIAPYCILFQLKGVFKSHLKKVDYKIFKSNRTYIVAFQSHQRSVERTVSEKFSLHISQKVL